MRVFLDREICREDKEQILLAAMAAPTAGNQQLYTILDIMDQCEMHKELLHLPKLVFPAAMVVFGYPNEQQKEYPNRTFEEWAEAFCKRKYNSGFSREMTRSVGEYLKEYKRETF